MRERRVSRVNLRLSVDEKQALDDLVRALHSSDSQALRYAMFLVRDLLAAGVDVNRLVGQSKPKM